jgi:hypothetical protein
MKKIFLMIVFALFLFSCTTTTQQTIGYWKEYTRGNTP